MDVRNGSKKKSATKKKKLEFSYRKETDFTGISLIKYEKVHDITLCREILLTVSIAIAIVYIESQFRLFSGKNGWFALQLNEL